MPDFGEMLQIGIVTDDLEKSVEQFRLFGFDTWEPMTFDSDLFPGMLVDGKEGELKLSIAVCRHENTEFELIQPLSEGVFMDWLREHGTGIHHIAFKPKDGYGQFMEDYEKLGCGSVIDVSFPGTDRGFTYLNTLKPLGFYTEIHKGAPGKPEDLK